MRMYRALCLNAVLPQVLQWVQEAACENCEQSKAASEAIGQATAAAQEAAEAEAVADAADRAEAAAAAAADTAGGRGRGKGKKVPKFERLRLTGEASHEDTTRQCAAETRLLSNASMLLTKSVCAAQSCGLECCSAVPQ